MYWILNRGGLSANRVLYNGDIESRLISDINPLELVDTLPAYPPTVQELKDAIQTQIDQIEKSTLVPRVTREALLLWAVSTAQAQGITEPQLYLMNDAYRKIKDVDTQIQLLRAQKDAII